MSRKHVSACVKACILASCVNSVMSIPSVLANEPPVEMVFTDSAPAGRAALPKMSSSAVFQKLIRSAAADEAKPDSKSSLSEVAPKRKASAWVPQAQTVAESVPSQSPQFLTASFSQLESNIEIVPAAPAPQAEPSDASVNPLTGDLLSQNELFNRLWGKNNSEEAPGRYASQVTAFPQGTSVRMFTDKGYGDRFAANGVYTWAAPAMFHHPLYFEQVNLERYGQGHHHAVQPVLSAAHFFATIPKLPYHVATAPPSEKVYTLGHYRPGDCAPYQWHRTRFSWKGVFVQGLASAGSAVVVP